MKKHALKISSLFILVALFAILLPRFTSAINFNIRATEDDCIKTIYSPDETVELKIYLKDSKLYYSTKLAGFTMVETSLLGFNTNISGGNFSTGFSNPISKDYQSNTSWNPLVGLDETIVDNHKGSKITFEHTSNLDLTMDFRVYDEGVAFKYILPEHDAVYNVTDDYSSFTIPTGAMALAHNKNNQTDPTYTKVESLGTDMERPLTIIHPNGKSMVIAEADVENFSVIKLKKTGTSTIMANLQGDPVVGRNITGTTNRNGVVANWTVEDSIATETPWRVMMMGNTTADMLASYTMVDNLSDRANEELYEFSSFVDPGACVRAAKSMTNDYIKTVVDEAKEDGLKYVLLDTGWYGPEDDGDSDPRLDPKKLDPNHPKDQILSNNYYARKNEQGEYTDGWFDESTGKYTGEGVFNTRGKGFHKYGDNVLGQSGTFQAEIDIPELCDYANERGIGIVLYVNNKCFPDQRNRFTTDELFGYFEKWGVAGVKPGFVRHGQQFDEAYMESVIKSAAEHKLILTIHDEYVPAGLTAEYPNLFQTEGVLGDEHGGSNRNDAIVRSLFTRPMQSPTDHTFIWPGPGQNAKASKAFQLASGFMFRAGMPVLYWYTSPSVTTDDDVHKMDIWNDLPGTWDETRYLEANVVDSHATIAKRSKDTWYLGSIYGDKNKQPTFDTSLDFLDEDTKYLATFYVDDPSTTVQITYTNGKPNNTVGANTILHNEKYIVDSQTYYKASLKYGTGFAATFTKATASDIATYPEYVNDVTKVVTDIKIDGNSIDGFDKYVFNYTVDLSFPVNKKPTITVQVSDEAVKYEIYQSSDLKSQDTVTAFYNGNVIGKYYINYNYVVDETNQEKLGSLSDLTPINADVHYNHIGKDVEVKNKENNATLQNSAIPGIYGGQYSGGTQIPLSLKMADGTIKTFEKGIGVHAKANSSNAYVTYDISNVSAARFKCLVGPGLRTTETYEISWSVSFYVDGEKVADTGLMYKKPNGEITAPKEIDINIQNASELKIVINSNGSNSGDEINICDTFFYGSALDQSIVDEYYNELTNYLKDDITTELEKEIAKYLLDNAKTNFNNTSDINVMLDILYQTKQNLNALCGNSTEIEIANQRIAKMIAVFQKYSEMDLSLYSASNIYKIISRYNEVMNILASTDSVDTIKNTNFNPSYSTSANSFLANLQKKLELLEIQYNNIDKSFYNTEGLKELHKIYNEAIMEVKQFTTMEQLDSFEVDYSSVKVNNGSQIGALNSISINGNKIENFDVDTLEYEVKISCVVTSINVTAVSNTNNVSINIKNPINTADKATIDVYLLDGSKVTYTITFKTDFEVKPIIYLTELGNKVGVNGIKELSLHNDTWNINTNYEKQAITLKDENGVTTTYENGIGTHANSDTTKSNATFDITNKGYIKFETLVGITPGKAGDFSAKFFVTRNGVESMVESQRIYANSNAVKVTIDLTDVTEFRIYFDCNGTNSNDHANLANAFFTVGGIPSDITQYKASINELIDSTNVSDTTYSSDNIVILNKLISDAKSNVESATSLTEIKHVYDLFTIQVYQVLTIKEEENLRSENDLREFYLVKDQLINQIEYEYKLLMLLANTESELTLTNSYLNILAQINLLETKEELNNFTYEFSKIIEDNNLNQYKSYAKLIIEEFLTQSYSINQYIQKLSSGIDAATSIQDINHIIDNVEKLLSLEIATSNNGVIDLTLNNSNITIKNNNIETAFVSNNVDKTAIDKIIASNSSLKYENVSYDMTFISKYGEEQNNAKITIDFTGNESNVYKVVLSSGKVVDAVYNSSAKTLTFDLDETGVFVIMSSEKDTDPDIPTGPTPPTNPSEHDNNTTPIIIAIVLTLLLAGGSGATFYYFKNKK